MNRPRVPVRLAVFGAVLLALAGLALAFALTSRPNPPAATSAPAASRMTVAPTSAAPMPPTAHAPTAAPTTAGPAASEPGEEPTEPSATPDVDPAAVEAGVAFAAAWLNRDDPEWPRKLTDRSTPDLAQVWASADPTTVPAGRGGGPVAGQTVTDGLADVRVPVVDRNGGPVGLLTLELTATGRGWLVSDVDWAAAA